MAAMPKLSPKQYKQLVKLGKMWWYANSHPDFEFATKYPDFHAIASREGWNNALAVMLYEVMLGRDNKYTKAIR